MRQMLVPVAAVALLVGMHGAMAAETTGAIKSIDTKKHEIVLTSGEAYMLPAHFDAKKLKVGENVTVTFATKKGVNHASTVVAAKAK